MLRRAVTYLGAIGAACACVAAPAAAATTPPTLTAANGKKVQVVAGGLATPTAFAFGDGQVFEADFGNSNGPPPPIGGVFDLKGGKATLLPKSPPFVSGIAFRKGTLYVAAEFLAPQGKGVVLQKSELLAWSGWNGTKFTMQKVIYTAPKGFPGFNGIAFGADGRLYAGVDLDYTGVNDHGPATKKTPYLYDVLSFNAKGKDLQVVATGIRQPWQLAFPAGSSSPFVSDLGQDLGAKNPPDFLLRVKKGDAFGFPQCNWTSKKLCKGFAKPFKLFPPHTDVGGLGIIGKTLYMSEFGFALPAEIASMPLKGGKAKPFVTGFPKGDFVIGLGVFHNWVYFGDTMGFVYRVHT